jgi:hypothetical protein
MADELDAKLTRKQFIKLLIAGGTATAAASFFPGKWVKPIMKVGVLPAHAQGSNTLTASNLQLFYAGIGKETGKGAGLASPVKLPSTSFGMFDYVDPEAGIDMDTTVYLENELLGTLVNNQSLSSLSGVINGTSASGLIRFNFFLNSYTNGLFTLSYSSGGRTSNEISGYLEEPA